MDFPLSKTETAKILYDRIFELVAKQEGANEEGIPFGGIDTSAEDLARQAIRALAHEIGISRADFRKIQRDLDDVALRAATDYVRLTELSTGISMLHYVENELSRPNVSMDTMHAILRATAYTALYATGEIPSEINYRAVCEAVAQAERAVASDTGPGLPARE